MPRRKDAGWLFFRIGDCAGRRVAGCCSVEMETYTDRPLDAAAVFKALGHPARLKVARELVSGERCVFDLVALTGLGWSTVSRHLSVMREAGVLAFERRGQQLVYRLELPCVSAFIEVLDRGGQLGAEGVGQQEILVVDGVNKAGDMEKRAGRVAEAGSERCTEAEAEVGWMEGEQIAAGQAAGGPEEKAEVMEKAAKTKPKRPRAKRAAAVTPEKGGSEQQELQLGFDWGNNG